MPGQQQDDSPAPQHHGPRGVAVSVIERLVGAGHTAYLAGGCVRDELLGRAPTDYDVATDARPDQIAALFPRTNLVGAAFGVVLVHSGATVTEVATFRHDGAYSDRRRPDSVTFSTPEDDAQRRDFTINALFRDPLDRSEPGGRVIDFVGGRADLEAGLVRAVGDPDDRLREDDLRSLRAVRFACRLGFEIEPATADAIRAHAGDLAGVSRERIGDEVRRLFTHPSRAHAAGLLNQFGLTRAVFGELLPATGRTDVLAAMPDDAPFEASLAALAVDGGIDPYAAGARGPLVAALRGLLCLSNDERDALAGTLRTIGDLLHHWPGLPMARQKRLATSACFAPAMLVVTAWKPALGAGIHERVAALAATESGLAPEPLLDGDALIRFGFRPGPGFKRILDGVYDAQLDGRVLDTAEAERLARELSGE